jgi:RNA-directed DNA polymerase
MSLETPIKIRMLQRKLYQKAKEEPSYRFYLDGMRFFKPRS